MPGLPAGDRAERLSRPLSPFIALLTATLALCCLVTLPATVAGGPALLTIDPRLAGWAGMAVLLAVLTALASLVGCSRFGSAPPLALGATAAVLGLALAHGVTGDVQLVLALLALGVAVGALFGSGLCMVEELSPRWAQAVFVAWAGTLAGGWGLLGWVALRRRATGVAQLGVHPPGWIIVAGAALLLCWAVLTLVVEPRRLPGPPLAGWENAWAVYLVLVVAVASTAMLLGFQPDHRDAWVRPVILLAIAAALGGLIAGGFLVPLPSARPAYVAVTVALLAGPGCLHVMLLVSSESSGPLGIWVAVLLAVAGLLGCWWGWRFAPAAASGGLLVMAVAAAAGWWLPGRQWAMCAAAAPFAVGLAAATMGGLRTAAATRMGLRYVSMAGLAALLFGLLAAAPLTWALGAELTDHVSAARAGGRVLLGLTFALAVLGTAVASVAQSRAGEDDSLAPRVLPGGDGRGPVDVPAAHQPDEPVHP